MNQDSKMSTATVGPTGLESSRQGLGCMGMSEFYGPTDDERSLAVIHRALDAGITHLDTADMYGTGHNEELLARVLRTRRSEALVATKFGILRDAADHRARAIRCDADYVRDACEASLGRLGVDTIDLYYMHRVDLKVPIEETVGAMAELVAAGKVRHLGLSEVNPTELRRAAAVHPIAAVQSEYSLFSRDVEDALLPACAELGVGFVAYSPLGRGFLTGAVTSTEGLTDTDFRHQQPRFAAAAAAHNARLLAPLRAIAAGHGVVPGQVALAWLHQRRDVWGVPVIPIPGTRRLTRLEENAAAVELRLAEAEIERLNAIAAQVAGDRYPNMSMTSAAADRSQ